MHSKTEQFETTMISLYFSDFWASLIAAACCSFSHTRSQIHWNIYVVAYFTGTFALDNNNKEYKRRLAEPWQGLAATQADVDDDDVDNHCNSRCSSSTAGAGAAEAKETARRSWRGAGRGQGAGTKDSLETPATSSAAWEHKVHCVWMEHVSGYARGLDLRLRVEAGLDNGWHAHGSTHTNTRTPTGTYTRIDRDRSESVAVICVTNARHKQLLHGRRGGRIWMGSTLHRPGNCNVDKTEKYNKKTSKQTRTKCTNWTCSASRSSSWNQVYAVWHVTKNPAKNQVTPKPKPSSKSRQSTWESV